MADEFRRGADVLEESAKTLANLQRRQQRQLLALGLLAAATGLLFYLGLQESSTRAEHDRNAIEGNREAIEANRALNCRVGGFLVGVPIVKSPEISQADFDKQVGKVEDFLRALRRQDCRGLGHVTTARIDRQLGNLPEPAGGSPDGSNAPPSEPPTAPGAGPGRSPPSNPATPPGRPPAPPGMPPGPPHPPPTTTTPEPPRPLPVPQRVCRRVPRLCEVLKVVVLGFAAR